MPRKSRDNLGIFFPNTPNTLNSQPSLFFGVFELNDPLGKQTKIFEELIGEQKETIPPNYTMAKNRNGIGDKEGDENRDEGDFPIRETNGDARMKNISPSSLPHFNGLTLEDPDTFLFEFFVIYKTYDYTYDDKKLKLFPSTLKDVALCWFMGLPGDIIPTWSQMQQAFNNKYRDYYKSKDTREEIFRMTLGHDESSKGYEERF